MSEWYVLVQGVAFIASRSFKAGKFQAGQVGVFREMESIGSLPCE